MLSEIFNPLNKFIALLIEFLHSKKLLFLRLRLYILLVGFINLWRVLVLGDVILLGLRSSCLVLILF